MIEFQNSVKPLKLCDKGNYEKLISLFRIRKMICVRNFTIKCNNKRQFNTTKQNEEEINGLFILPYFPSTYNILQLQNIIMSQRVSHIIYISQTIFSLIHNYNEDLSHSTCSKVLCYIYWVSVGFGSFTYLHIIYKFTL